jgi:putative methyltransferase
MRKVYFNEYNVPTENSIYLPFSSGLLQAYAQQFEEVRDNYIFQPFLFIRETLDTAVERHKDPDVVCFSASVWNYELSLAIAKKVKEKHPSAYIVFGGPNIPPGPQADATRFFETHPFIDLVIYGEGERIFTDALIDRLHNKEQHHVVVRHDEPARELDIFPSPYVEDVFEPIMSAHPDIEFKAIVETNRSCPFSCSFCFWGQSSFYPVKKMSYHSPEYITKEAEWIGKNKIPYVFCADANFGMFKRDVDIAHSYATVKSSYGYPEKFRVCYGKNATETIFETATILSKADLAKTVTLAIQSSDEDALKAIRRSNIKKETFDSLQERYTKAGIPTYTELILGLPGETKETFINGIQGILESVINNQIFIYHCQILPNTEMADPDYIKGHGIITVKIPLAEVHGSYRSDDLIQEFEENIIGTTSMPVEVWKECAVIAWTVQLMHALKIGFDVARWLVANHDIKYMDFYTFLATSNMSTFKQFQELAEDITQGKARCQIDPKYGNIYYEPEEMAFLNVVLNKKKFYRELHAVLIKFFAEKGLPYDKKIKDVINRQADQLPEPENFRDTQELAREVVLYGRKSNKLTTDILNRPDAPLIFPFS